MKTCTKCGEEKDINCFTKDKSKVDGLRPSCKDCKKISDREYYRNNTEAIGNKGKKYNEKTKDRRIEYKKEYYSKNKETIDLRNKQNYYKNIDARRERNRLTSSLKKEELKLYKRKYRTENKGLINNSNATRRANRLNASILLTSDQLNEIKEIYMKAQTLTKQTGISYHVDHIIPLQGKTVCGLHVPWNLQILTREENLKKHTKLPQEVL